MVDKLASIVFTKECVVQSQHFAVEGPIQCLLLEPRAMDSTTTDDASLSRGSDGSNHSLSDDDEAGLLGSSAVRPMGDTQLGADAVPAFVVGEEGSGAAPDFSNIRRELRPSSFASADNAHCTLATSTLLIPFSFWPAEDLETPRWLVQNLLQRTVCTGHGSSVALWESAMLPQEVEELSAHFRQLLNAEGSNASPLHLKLTDAALNFLFSGACLLADTQDNQIGKKRCQWKRVRLSVFHFGAIISFTVDWMSGPTFTLADWRLWMHVAKFRASKPGTTHGWTFRRHAALVEPDEAQLVCESLGPELYEALYGGNYIGLSSVANWLVKLPSERASCKRVSPHDFCLHHSFVRFYWPSAFVASNPQVGSTSAISSYPSDDMLELWTNCTIVMSMEGMSAFEVQAHEGGKGQTRSDAFMGIFETLVCCLCCICKCPYH